jgi:RNA-splicing ligase RtcB
MRTGNAFWQLTFEAAPEPTCRLTLLDAGADEAVAELVVESLPWEESASVPVEAMSAFREAMEAVPETWDSSATPVDTPGLMVTGSFEVSGVARAFELSLSSPADVPTSFARFLSALASAAGAALAGGKSRRMLAVLERWGRVVSEAPGAPR